MNSEDIMECCDPVRMLLISLELGLLICKMGTPISQKRAGQIKWNHVCKVTSAVTFSSSPPPLAAFSCSISNQHLGYQVRELKNFFGGLLYGVPFFLIFPVVF